ncbi:MAG: phage holin family protein [Chthoniobacterales bacterium]
MASEPMRFRNPAGHAGLLNNLIALANALSGFFGSRAALVAHESKGALVHVLVLLGALIAAGLLFALGYIFLLGSAIIGVAHALQVSVVWIALAAAVLHFILCGVCVLIAKSRMSKPMFAMSTAELKRDREWLKNLDKQNLPTS